MGPVFKGATDQTLYFVLVDSTTGLPETGVAHTSVTGSYARNRGNRTAITMANLAAPDSAHADGGWEEVDATNQPGLYRFDIPDAAFATGADKVIISVVVTGVKSEHQLIPLWDWNTQLAVLPNAAFDSAGGLIISDAGGLDADAQRSDVAAILVDTGTTLDARIPAALVGGRIDANVGAISGDAAAADNLEAAADGTGFNLGGGAVVAASVTGAVGSVTGAVGSVTAGVTLAASAVQAIWDALTSALTTVGSIGKLLVDNINATIGSRASQTTADAIEVDTADIQSRLPAALVSGRMASDAVAISGATAAADALEANIANLDATVSSRLATAGYTVPPTAAANADAVWDEVMADHLTGGTTGAALNGAGSAGDPWTTPLPGAYGAGTAGKIVGDNINATISSRASQASVDVIDGNVDAVLIDTAEIGAAGAGLTAVAWNAAWDAEVQSEVADALAVYDAPTSAALVSEINSVQADIAALVIPSAAANADAVWDEARTDHTAVGSFGQGVASVQGNVTGSAASVTGNVGGNLTGSVGSLAAQAKADVAQEISDALRVDVIAELSQAAPAVTPTFATAVMLIYMALRNEVTQSETEQTIANNAGTVIAKGATSDSGTVFTRAQLASGP